MPNGLGFGSRHRGCKKQEDGREREKERGKEREGTGNYLNKLPLPGLQYSRGLVLVPVDVVDLVVILKMLIELLGAHEEEHGLERFRTEGTGHTTSYMSQQQQQQPLYLP